MCAMPQAIMLVHGGSPKPVLHFTFDGTAVTGSRHPSTRDSRPLSPDKYAVYVLCYGKDISEFDGTNVIGELAARDTRSPGGEISACGNGTEDEAATRRDVLSLAYFWEQECACGKRWPRISTTWTCESARHRQVRDVKMGIFDVDPA